MRLALVTVDGRVPGWVQNGPAPIEPVDQYDLPGRRLRDWNALLIPMHADQRHLRSLSSRLCGFLDNGGTLVVNGAVAHPFLPELTRFVPLPRRNLESLKVYRLAPHTIFDGVDATDLTYRRGVAGFYGRGHNPPPADALALNGLGPDRVPVDWLWLRGDGGRVLMHAGNDLWMYAEDRTSARRLLPQLQGWLLTGFGERTRQ